MLSSNVLSQVFIEKHFMKWNSTKIMLWTFLSTSEEMLLNCYNQNQGGPMRAFLVWSWGLYEVSLHCLWFRLPLVDRFSKFTFYIDLFTNLVFTLQHWTKQQHKSYSYVRFHRDYLNEHGEVDAIISGGRFNTAQLS